MRFHSLKQFGLFLATAALPVLANAHNFAGSGLSTYQPLQQGYGQPAYSQQQQYPQTGYPGTFQSNPYGYGVQQAPAAIVSPYQNGIISVITRQLGAHVVLGGTVIPFRQVTLTAQIPGRVQFIAGMEGDQFETNQVLVAIDDDDLLAQRRQAVAQLQAMMASLRNARVQYSREFWSPQIQQRFAQPAGGGGGGGLFPAMFDRFFGGGGGNQNPWAYGNPWIERQADLYSRGSNVSQENAQLMALRAKVDEIDARLLDSRSIAPFNGVILKKLVEIGDTVQPGQPLLQYADRQDLQIQLDVPARLMPGISKGMILPAALDVGDIRVNARVAQIFPLADSKRHTVTVKLDLPKGIPGGPGMYAEVEIPDISVPVSTVPIIPSSAILWRGSLPAVVVVNAENKNELRLIRLGEKLPDRTVAVLSGLRPGERIYASPPPGLNSNWKPKSKNVDHQEQ